MNRMVPAVEGPAALDNAVQGTASNLPNLQQIAFGRVEGSWGEPLMGRITFELLANCGVGISHIFVGYSNLGEGKGGQMIAYALSNAGINNLTSIKISPITDEPTHEMLKNCH
jgi:hypothetical protein